MDNGAARKQVPCLLPGGTAVLQVGLSSLVENMEERMLPVKALPGQARPECGQKRL